MTCQPLLPETLVPLADGFTRKLLEGHSSLLRNMDVCVIMSSPNSYLAIELTLLLQRDLGSELQNLGQKTWLLKLEHEAKSIFKYPTPLLPPPGREGPSRLRLRWNLGGLLGHQMDGCRVCGVLPTVVRAEITAPQTPSQRKVLSG